MSMLLLSQSNSVLIIFTENFEHFIHTIKLYYWILKKWFTERRSYQDIQREITSSNSEKGH